ncbi:hypothetical protein J4421_03895 [Candidatus Woesearchaeota archaeon]|nr:hypothetical protein [Candidatus Woesearchaeota archaeon]
MAFRSLSAAIIGVVLSVSTLAKAEEASVPPSHPVTVSSSVSFPTLDLRLGVRVPPQITFDTYNRCPPQFREILQPPPFVTELPLANPLRELVLDAFGGEKSTDSEYDDLRREILESRPSLCVREEAFTPPQKESLERALSPFPKESSVKEITGGSHTSIRLELPGDLHYVLLGEERHRIEYEAGSLAYSFIDKNLEAIIDGKKKTYHLPSLSLKNITIGNMSLQSFREELKKFPEARDDFGSAVDNFTTSVLHALDLVQDNGQPTGRGLELGLKLRGVFEKILPQYLANDGVIDPDEWGKIEESVSREIKAFRNDELNEAEKEALDKELTKFRNNFAALQWNHPLIENIWRIFSRGLFSEIKLGAISIADAYAMLRALGPDLYNLKLKNNVLSFASKPLHSTLDGRSSNFKEIYYGDERRFVETNDHTIQLSATGKVELLAQLTEGTELKNYLPERYREDFDLLKLILAIDPKFPDIEIMAAGEFLSKFWALKSNGFMTDFKRKHYTLGIDISFGLGYENLASGSAFFHGFADSNKASIGADFQGEIQIWQFQRKQQQVGFFLLGDFPSSWFETRIWTELEQSAKMMEYLGATWKFRADYQINLQQNAWSQTKLTERNTFSTLNFGGSLRGGVNLGLVDLFVFTDFQSGGGGFFINTPRVNAWGECSFWQYCQAAVRLATDNYLNTKKAREHFLRLQHLEDSTLAGVESIRVHENYLFNMHASGLFLDAAFSYRLSDAFPYERPTNSQVGVVMVEPTIGKSINLYWGMKYEGNFVDVHGLKLDLGSKYWESFFGIKWAKDKTRNSNAIYATSGLTFHFSKFDLVSRHELYPAPLDEEPEYVQTESINPHTGKAIRRYKVQKEENYKILIELRSSPDAIDQLLETIIANAAKVKLHDLTFVLQDRFRIPYHYSGEVAMRVSFGNLSVYNEVTGVISTTGERSLALVTEANYNLYAGFGPALHTTVYLDREKEKKSLIPGFGYEGRPIKDHYLKAQILGWERDGMYTEVKVRYIYNDQTKKISPYLKIDGHSRFTLTLPDGVTPAAEDHENSLRVLPGVRNGPFIFTAYGELKKKEAFTGDVGFAVGVDFLSF